MGTSRISCARRAWLVMAWICALALPLHAQEGLEDDPFAGIEEMVVIGQTGSQMLQDMAVSVATFDDSYLEALGASNIKDIAQFTPNLEIRSPFSASNPTLFIRGVGLRDFNANSSSSVAVFNDEVYMNSPAGQLAQLFDVQTVEVHRGPQGTLYARNASAGAIKVVTKKPSGRVEGYLKSTYGRFDEISVEGAMETPIYEDLSIRVAGVFNIRDGFTRNRCAARNSWINADRSRRQDIDTLSFTQCYNSNTVADAAQGGQSWNAGIPGRTGEFVLSRRGLQTAEFAQTPQDVHKWVNDRDNWGARALIRYNPAEEIDFVFNVHGGQNRGLARQFEGIGRSASLTGDGLSDPQPDLYTYVDADQILEQGIPPILTGDPTRGDPFEGDYNNTGKEKLDLVGANLTGDMIVGDWKFQTVSAWEYNSRDVEANLDGGPFIGIEIDYGNRAWQLSQELKAVWEPLGPFSFEGGAYYLHEKLTVDNTFRLSRTGAVIQTYEQTTDAFAFYWQGYWELSELFDIEAGMRWNFEFKEVDIESGPAQFGPPPFELNPQLAGNATTDVSKDAPTGNVTFNYRPLSDVNMYVKFARGWKGPHINGGVIGLTGAGTESLLDPADPEEVNSVEVGFKATLWASRFRFNTAGFYYDYENMQIFQLKNESGGVPTQVLLNADDAEVFGVEIEVDVTPLDGFVPPAFEGLRIFGSFAWLQSEYTNFKNTKINFVGNQAIPILEDFSGNRLINSPEYSFTGYAQWMFEVGRLGRIGPRLDWSFKDRVYFNQNNFNALSQGPLWLLNLRMDYQTADGFLELSGWVRNLLDEEYVGDAINLTSFAQRILYAIGDPRTYGITATVRF